MADDLAAAGIQLHFVAADSQPAAGVGMKTFVGLFSIAGAFGAAIAVAYYFVAHEETVGTAMLAVMTAALVLCAGYAVVAERAAALEGDEATATPADAAGDDLGIFTTQSAYPILAATFVLATLLGVLWSPIVAAIASSCLALTLWRMGAESARN